MQFEVEASDCEPCCETKDEDIIADVKSIKKHQFLQTSQVSVGGEDIEISSANERKFIPKIISNSQIYYSGETTIHDIPDYLESRRLSTAREDSNYIEPERFPTAHEYSSYSHTISSGTFCIFKLH